MPRNNATVWMTHPDDQADLVEGEDADVSVGQTDVDEVTISVVIEGVSAAVVALHFTRAEAALLAAGLARTATSTWRGPHGA